MTHEQLTQALEGDGWIVDGDEITRHGSVVLLHSDGRSVAVAHAETFPLALATDASNALAWARGEDFDVGSCAKVRLA